MCVVVYNVARYVCCMYLAMCAWFYIYLSIVPDTIIPCLLQPTVCPLYFSVSGLKGPSGISGPNLRRCDDELVL